MLLNVLEKKRKNDRFSFVSFSPVSKQLQIEFLQFVTEEHQLVSVFRKLFFFPFSNEKQRVKTKKPFVLWFCSFISYNVDRHKLNIWKRNVLNLPLTKKFIDNHNSQATNISREKYNDTERLRKRGKIPRKKGSLYQTTCFIIS